MMSPQKMKKEEECVTEMLTGGQIEPSGSPWSSPVVLVTKKDGGTRFFVDYRRLNDVTVVVVGLFATIKYVWRFAVLTGYRAVWDLECPST